MGKPNFSDEFKRDAVAQITDRGYRVRLGRSLARSRMLPSLNPRMGCEVGASERRRFL
ncbi:hypothetical protein GRI58_11515 [Porphyrobacter algicida]|uniref:Transposase n=1 Tax=Qipengyuania algicida TaxID=1836209 RepID=A0A845ARC5_9SPHN|nr:hypothetical protein [Qipengyuania algicida]